MPSPSVTYQFTNGTTADGPNVSTNFNDLVSALTDGTKDLTVLSVTATTITATTFSGNLTFSGNVTLGNDAADTTTITGILTSNILPTDVTYTLGNSTHNFKSLFLDNAATDGGAIDFNAGTTSFLKSSADGTRLDVGGFTTFGSSSDGAVQLGSTSHRFSGLALTGDVGTGTPAMNFLYSDTISKAWANTASAGTLNAGVNLTVSRPGTGQYDYVFRTNLANVNYSVVATGPDSIICGVGNYAVSGFRIFTRNSSFALANSDHNVIVIGAQ